MDLDLPSPYDKDLSIVETTELDEPLFPSTHNSGKLRTLDPRVSGYSPLQRTGDLVALRSSSIPLDTNSDELQLTTGGVQSFDGINPQNPQYDALESSHPVLQQPVVVVVPPSKFKPLPYATARSGLVYDVRMRFHENLWENSHPESPRRIVSIFNELIDAGLVAEHDELDDDAQYKLVRINARFATKEEICLIHTAEHVDWVESLANLSIDELQAIGERLGDANSIYVNNSTWLSATLSTGGSINATKAVINGQVRNAIALVRPPGHHAEHNRAEGFCFFNNVPIAAKIAQLDYPELVRKILILDWDVHHGNGIQRAFYDDPNVLYISLHLYENGIFYPGLTFGDWGDHLHCGEGAGLGRNINIPWSVRGMGDAEYIYAFQEVIMPIGIEFDPDLVFISAGFDAAEGDTLGECHVTPACYGHMTHMLMQLARGKVVSCLEGGYNLDSIAKSALSMTRVMMGEPPDRMPPLVASVSGTKDVQKVIRQQAKFWKCMYPKDRELKGKTRDHRERLHDILRKHQSERLYEEHQMLELFVRREKLSKSFEKQVLATENYFCQNPLLVIFHDPPEVDGLPDTITSRLEAHNTFITDVCKTYIDWAVKKQWAVIDVNVPRHMTQPDDNHEYQDSDSQEERISAASDLLKYLWDNYIDVADSTHIFFLGIGDAYLGIIDAYSKHRDAVARVDHTVGFLSANSPIRGVNRADESEVKYFYQNSTVFVAQDHPLWDLEHKPRRKHGLLIRSEPNDIQEMLIEHKSRVTELFLDLTQDWVEQRRDARIGLSNGGAGDDVVVDAIDVDGDYDGTDLLIPTVGLGDEAVALEETTLFPTAQVRLTSDTNGGGLDSEDRGGAEHGWR